jgi:hypothetical protein
MPSDRAIIHKVLVEYEVETNLGGHRPQVLKATVLDHSQAKVFDGGTFRHPLAASDNRVLRTRTWLKRNIKF